MACACVKMKYNFLFPFHPTRTRKLTATIATTTKKTTNKLKSFVNRVAVTIIVEGNRAVMCALVLQQFRLLSATEIIFQFSEIILRVFASIFTSCRGSAPHKHPPVFHQFTAQMSICGATTDNNATPEKCLTALFSARKECGRWKNERCGCFVSKYNFNDGLGV